MSGAVPQAAPVSQEIPPPTILTVPTFNPNPMVQIVRPTGGVLKRPLEQVTCFKVGNPFSFLVLQYFFASVETRAIMPIWYGIFCTSQVLFSLLQCPNSYRSIMLATQSGQLQPGHPPQHEPSQPQPIQSIETIGTVTSITAAM